MIHLHEHWPVGYVVGHTGVRGSPNGSVSGRWFATMMLTHWTFWPDGADTWDDPIPVPPLDAASLASFNGALLTAGSASTQATLQAAGPTSPIAEPTSPIGTSPPMSQQDSRQRQHPTPGTPGGGLQLQAAPHILAQVAPERHATINAGLQRLAADVLRQVDRQRQHQEHQGSQAGRTDQAAQPLVQKSQPLKKSRIRSHRIRCHGKRRWTRRSQT